MLEPVERLSEILFGLIMALTFTGSIHAATDGREEIRTMLFGAIGCNIAWGIVDAVMYLLTDLVDRNRTLNWLRSLRATTAPEQARSRVAEGLPQELSEVLQPGELDTLRGWLERVPVPPGKARITAHSVRGALGVFLLVSLSTFPMVVPFLFLSEPTVALRTSHAVGLSMLFMIGALFGRTADQHPLRIGLWMVGIGLVLVLLAIALGG